MNQDVKRDTSNWPQYTVKVNVETKEIMVDTAGYDKGRTILTNRLRRMPDDSICNHTSIRFTFWEAIRLLFGRQVHISVITNTKQDPSGYLRVVGTARTTIKVDDLFIKKESKTYSDDCCQQESKH